MSDTPANSTTPAVPGSDSASHLEAAKAFFSASDSSATQQTQQTQTQQNQQKTETKVEQKTETKTEVPSIFKKQGEQKTETKVEQTQTEEAPDWDKLTGPDEKSKHRPDWDKMKAAAAQERKARLEYEKKLKEYETKLAQRGPDASDEATKARLAQLEQQAKDYSDRLKIYDLQSHPEFVNQYVAPVQQAVQSIKDTLKLEGIEADVDRIMALEGKAFTKAVSDLLGDASEFSKLQLADAFRKAKLGEAARKEALGKHDQIRAELQQKFAARSKQAFDEVARQVTENFVPAVADEKADDAEKQSVAEYNAGLAKLSKRSEELAFGNVGERGAAEMAHKAASFEFLAQTAIPRMERLFTRTLAAKDSEIAKLRSELAELTATRPKVTTNGSDGSQPKNLESMGHLEAAREFFPDQRR
jgi:hypothetical protein